MALTDFFRINLPYGMNKNSKGEWMLFNREYMPIGWKDSQLEENVIHNSSESKLPLYAKYKGLTDNIIIKKLGQGNHMIFNKEGELVRVFFYNDKTNPTNINSSWEPYFEIIKWLSKFQVK